MQMVNVVLKARARPAVRRAHAPAPLLDGIRSPDWTSRPALARRLGLALAARGEVAYCVEGPDDRRALPAPKSKPFAELADSLRRELLRLAVAIRATGGAFPTAMAPH